MTNRTVRYCRCGTRLARDNPQHQCAACQSKTRGLAAGPPDVPVNFWDTDEMRDALATWNMGQVIAAYRHHRFHGRTIRQELVAGWVGITQAQLSRIEGGSAMKDLDRLAQWARTLGIPAGLLWFKLPEQSARREADEQIGRHPEAGGSGDGRDHACGTPSGVEDMHRRELLRLLSLAAPALTAAGLEDRLDLDRLEYVAADPRRLDAAALDAYETVNRQLWTAFSSAKRKSTVLPLVSRQLDTLFGALREARRTATRRRLCALSGDLLQLAGEVLFDGNHYVDAANCYVSAAVAGREATDFDLWACAMTRHAFISVYERQPAHALSMLDGAGRLAARGDAALSTRYWIDAVLAEAAAGVGDLDSCARALDRAERVSGLGGQFQNGGWLRFDGSRLAEQRGTCYVQLRRPDLAEPALLEALDKDLSLRRHGGVLVDLAHVGVQLRDPDRLVMYADAALVVARQTGSGVITRRLHGLRRQLGSLTTDRHVGRIDREIGQFADDRQ
ncbi:helix-turn-helix transcriptional regulator [Plantactinospora sp. KLBMP9567]|uniref:helix-turn-helix domain-containing protein n=1 Tax=Plantactinospora sp. KLBMP9567 TaxID=3085900 RepID=UPI002981D44F|nr:helix-turn-helix transcriptional regulator [Plantactinospora sp. KLBMP9567]MDW5324478.1 helix-turn-helix transcriptional regulator [Plantactinospora sp. KLBMP9567]